MGISVRQKDVRSLIANGYLSYHSGLAWPDLTFAVWPQRTYCIRPGITVCAMSRSRPLLANDKTVEFDIRVIKYAGWRHCRAHDGRHRCQSGPSLLRNHVLMLAVALHGSRRECEHTIYVSGTSQGSQALRPGSTPRLHMIKHARCRF